jgi:hypothetical protein
MCHPGSHWTGFREIWCWGLLKKICRRTPRFWHSTWRTQCLSYCWLRSTGNSFLHFDKKNLQHLLHYWQQYKGNFFRFIGNNGYANRHIVTLHTNYLLCYNPPTGQISRKKLPLSFALRSVYLSYGARFLNTWLLLDRKEKFWRKRNFVEKKGEIMSYVLKCSKFHSPKFVKWIFTDGSVGAY